MLRNTQSNYGRRKEAAEKNPGPQNMGLTVLEKPTPLTMTCVNLFNLTVVINTFSSKGG